MAVTLYTFENGLDWIVDNTQAVSNFHAFYATKTGYEWMRKGELEALHFLEHLFFRRGTIEKTTREAVRIANNVMRTNGETAPTFCFGKVSGPTIRRISVVDTAYRGFRQKKWDQRQLDLERSILWEELSENLDAPDEIVSTHLLGKVFAGTPYGFTNEDSIGNLPNIDLKTLTGLRRRILHPGNMLLITVGRLHGKGVDRVVERTFGSLPARRSPYSPPDLTPNAPFLLVQEREALQKAYVSHYLFDTKAPVEMHRIALLHVLNDIIGDEDSSILFRKLRNERGQAYTTKSYESRDFRPTPHIQIEYSCNPEYVERNVDIIIEALSRIAERGISTSVVERFKRLKINMIDKDKGDADERAEWYIRTSAINLVNPNNGRIVTQAALQKAIAQVTNQEIRAFVRDILPTFSTSVLYPKSPPTTTMLFSDRVADIRQMPELLAPYRR